MLRAAAPGDLEAMHQLDLQCFDEAFRFNLASMIRFATLEGTIALVADSRERLAGFVIVNVTRRGLTKVAYLTTLDVAPEFRRRGLARLLMERAEAEAFKAGASYAGLHVWTENEGARQFYEAAGYRRVRLAEDFYAPGMSAWVYRKQLRTERRAKRRLR